MSYVTGISGNVISAASAGWAPTNSAEVSAIASAYATGSEQVVTSLQYATSESATIATTVTADTAVGYGARVISAEYYDYGYGLWTDYDSSKPLVQVRMTAVGNMTNYSSNPYYLYVVPYGATNNGNVSTTSQLTGALAYGEFSMDDLIVAEGTGSANSQDPYVVEVNFDVTHVPFIGSEPAYWGTVEGSYAVVDDNEYTRPVFCVAGGYDGSNLFELRNNITAELDFGSIVTVSAVSGINELEIAGAGGGIDSATVSAIASSYAEDVSAAASGAVSAVSSNSADWMKLSSCFAGLSGIVTSVGSSTLFTPATASSFMGIGSAIKSTTGSGAGFSPNINYTMGLSGYYPSVKLSAHQAQTYVKYMDDGGSISTIYVGPTTLIKGVSGDISAYSTTGAFTLDYTANSVEPLAFQSDLTGAGVDSATVSAIASAYAESAVSSKADSSALSSYVPYSSLEYNTASAISGINGSALAAGSTYSAGEGIDITDDVISVEAPVDIVAGPGIVIDNPDGNTLRVSTDENYETVLWTGTLNTLNSNIECSENLSNFSTIKIFYRLVADSTVQSVGVHEFEPSEMSSGQNVSFGGFYLISNNFYGWWIGRLVVTDGYKVKITNTKNSWGTGASPSDGTANYSTVGFIYKIVGVHRIANN